MGAGVRFLLEFVDDALADAAGHLLIDRQERLLPRVLLGGRERADRRLAGLSHLLQGIVVLFLRDAVGIVRRLLHRFFALAAHIRRHCIPEFLVHDHRVADIAMVGNNGVFLLLVHLLGIFVGEGVLGAVDDAGL